ncbi:MAG: hypothetical protein M1582_01410, partial [Actinobacteria bacterium]|nr:hypothetical protein [Actinomycetota bacterium]
MRIYGRNLNLLRRVAPVLRLLPAALAALALAVEAQPVDINIVLVGSAYLAFVMLSMLLARRLDLPSLALVDS